MDPQLIPASEKDIPAIAQMAARIWRAHYLPIIGSAQVEYMLDKMYSEKSLSDQIKNGQNFFFVKTEAKEIGYISITQNANDFFLNKFYMEIDEQGKGYGKKIFSQLLLNFPELESIRLQVNRMNYKAINYYFKVGFVIDEAKDFDIGGGFFMKDYVMIYKAPVGRK